MPYCPVTCRANNFHSMSPPGPLLEFRLKTKLHCPPWSDYRMASAKIKSKWTNLSRKKKVKHQESKEGMWGFGLTPTMLQPGRTCLWPTAVNCRQPFPLGNTVWKGSCWKLIWCWWSISQPVNAYVTTVWVKQRQRHIAHGCVAHKINQLIRGTAVGGLQK